MVICMLITVAFFVKEKDMRYIERQLQLAINRIIAWTNKNGFIFSIDKTHCMHFCRVCGIHPDPDIFINWRQISISDTACSLDNIFDTITFLPHIFNLRTKWDKSLNILKVLSNTSWGADRLSLLEIYQAITRSKTNYVCQIYGSAGTSYLKKTGHCASFCTADLLWCFPDISFCELICWLCRASILSNLRAIIFRAPFLYCFTSTSSSSHLSPH